LNVILLRFNNHRQSTGDNHEIIERHQGMEGQETGTASGI
jgi:hypothetical protein